MISILCPTRARPNQCVRMIESVNNTVNEIVQIYLGFSQEDKNAYMGALEGRENRWPKCNVMVFPTCKDGEPTAHKWNKLASSDYQQTSQRLFMLGADDMIFETLGWDKALIDHYNSLENKIHVYALQDSRDKDGTPHPVFTREWIEFWGYMVNPMWLHWFVDTWAVEIAKANNCFTHLKDFSLRHDKPSDNGLADETHNRIRAWGWNERDRYVWEKSQDYLELDKRKLGEELGNL